MRFKEAFTSKQVVLSERDVLEGKYRIARNNLLIVVAFTLLNMIMVLMGSDSYMLFSASIPYYMVFYGMYLTGKMPADWYEGDLSEYSFLDNSFFVAMLVLAFMCVAFYALFWYFSRKHSAGWLIAALVFVVLDLICLFLLVGVDASILIDLVFHAWIIYEMVVGIKTVKKLKNLPPEEEMPISEEVSEGASVATEPTDPTDTEN